MNNIEKLLYIENNKEIKSYGEGFLLPPASKEDIENLKLRMKNTFDMELSNDYLRLLSLSDGFSVNGFNLYGSKIFSNGYFINGLWDANQEFREEPSLNKYIAYGDESSMRLVFNIENSCYEAVESISWDHIASFDSFLELLQYVFNDACIFN
ncbi:YrhA family protein [Photobacterium toruni]|uniref:SMI1 / KNR4 family protein n=1 Tax=Photobacterium toruni TaxID=1935446 RepID=A0A1T4UIA8_9GAMM|nr:YrhA family protein [Photobacterium toruni]SKA52336.1 hypothetical protein CZ814_03277 [Photobacterium toruni]